MKVDELAIQAAEALRKGLLPRVRVADFSGAYGGKGRCALCSKPIGETQLGASIQMGRVTYVLHVNCFHAWQMAVPPD